MDKKEDNPMGEEFPVPSGIGEKQDWPPKDAPTQTHIEPYLPPSSFVDINNELEKKKRIKTLLLFGLVLLVLGGGGVCAYFFFSQYSSNPSSQEIAEEEKDTECDENPDAFLCKSDIGYSYHNEARALLDGKAENAAQVLEYYSELQNKAVEAGEYNWIISFSESAVDVFTEYNMTEQVLAALLNINFSALDDSVYYYEKYWLYMDIVRIAETLGKTEIAEQYTLLAKELEPLYEQRQREDEERAVEIESEIKAIKVLDEGENQ